MRRRGSDTMDDAGEADAPLFDGPLLTPHDHARLGLQLAAVRDLMSDGRWRTLAEIAAAVMAPEASVSARLRDLRKPKHGSLTVERRREGSLYRYRVAVDLP